MNHERVDESDFIRIEIHAIQVHAIKEKKASD